MKFTQGKLIAAITGTIIAVSAIAFAETAPLPRGMTNKAVAGGDYGQFTKGATGRVGLNNVGLLIRTTGKVTFVDTASKFFYIDDGSKMIDAEPTLDPANGNAPVVGIRVSYANLATGNTFTAPTKGQVVVVTGISCLTCNVGGAQDVFFPTIRVRSSADMQ